MVEKRQLPARIRAAPNKLRDSRLIVIATEGRKTEKKYFEDLAIEYHNSRIKVHVLEKVDNHSSPEKILALLDNFKAQYSFEDDDTLWMGIDVDRWKQSKLSKIAQECSQKGYRLAVSNPSFEIWLLCHIKDINDYSLEQQQELIENKKDHTNRTRLEREIILILSHYNKSNLNTKDFLPGIEQAIEQAQSLDTNPDHRWTNGLGTRVYLIAKTILGKDERRMLSGVVTPSTPDE